MVGPRLVRVEWEPSRYGPEWYAWAEWGGFGSAGLASARRRAIAKAIWNVFVHRLVAHRIPVGPEPYYSPQWHSFWGRVHDALWLR